MKGGGVFLVHLSFRSADQLIAEVTSEADACEVGQRAADLRDGCIGWEVTGPDGKIVCKGKPAKKAPREGLAEAA